MAQKFESVNEMDPGAPLSSAGFSPEPDDRPLSVRTGKRLNPYFDGPQEGFPPYLFDTVWSWIDDQLSEFRKLERLQLLLRLEDPLDLSYGYDSARSDLRQRIEADPDLGLDVLDFLVRKGNTIASRADALDEILRLGGSAWEVAHVQDDRRLQRRAIGPIEGAVESIGESSERAETHLRTAWGHIMGRDPDPTGGYRESVRAVEVAARPVVSPADRKATLGKMRAALEAKPEKWDTVLHGGIELVVAEMDSLWRGQFDRHGTDDETVPISVSLDEADAAFHQALALTRLFAGAGVTRAHH